MRFSEWSSYVCSSYLQVAGVRVGMEEPVLEDHRQHHVDDASSEVRSVDARGVERLEIRHLDPGDPLEGDDPPSAGALVDEWDVHCRVSRQVGGAPPGVGRLDFVVELSAQRADRKSTS